MRATGILVVLAATLAAPLPGQHPVPPDSVSIALGPAYASTPGFRFLRGAGWRHLWIDTLRLPVLHSPGAGADRPEYDTTWVAGTVILRAADGTAQRLVPVDHDPVEFALAPRLRGTPAEQWLRDLTSTMHPTAPLVASALYQAVGLHAVRPRLAATADGRGVWVERAAELDGGPYGPFVRVIPSDSLPGLLRRDPSTRIDLRAFLKARLLDVLLGDRDRTAEHWRWGLDPQAAGGPAWVPIAVRQQQAFLRADGGDRFLLGIYEPGFVVFDAKRPPVGDLTRTGYDFDRPLLARLERSTWDSVAAALRSALTREVIDRAIAELPAEHWRASGADLADALEARRDALQGVVDDFYHQVVADPDIELSDAAESVRLTRLPSGDLDLRVSAGGPELWHRVFLASETRELRLHLGGGDDRVTLDVGERHGVSIRITGGSGHDVVEQTGEAGRRVVVYDVPDGITMRPEDAARLVPRAVERYRLWPDSGAAPGHTDWGVSRSPILAFDITGDLGVVVGGGMQWTWRGFDQPFYRQRVRASIEYASRAKGFRTSALFERRDIFRNIHLTAGVRVTGIDVVRFFGYGNETPFTEDIDYYLAETKEIGLTALVGVSRDPALEFRIGPALRVGGTDTTKGTTLVAATQPYGSGRFDMAGLEAQFNYTPRRARYEQGWAFQARANGRLYPKLLDVTAGPFGGVDAEARLTWVPQPASRFMLAGRLGGSVLGGTVPFSMTARVGGPKSLRGWETARFSGDRGSAYGGLEMRARLFRYRLGFLPGDFGVLAFGDAGRVWTDGESSSTMHLGGGGGLWIAPAVGWIRNLDDLIGRLELAWGGEHMIVSVGTGFRF
jgi:hypothetical protein